MVLQRQNTRVKGRNTFKDAYCWLLDCSQHAEIPNFLTSLWDLIHQPVWQVGTGPGGHILFLFWTCTCETLDLIRPQVCIWPWNQEGWEDGIDLAGLCSRTEISVMVGNSAQNLVQRTLATFSVSIILKRADLQPAVGGERGREEGVGILTDAMSSTCSGALTQA